MYIFVLLLVFFIKTVECAPRIEIIKNDSSTDSDDFVELRGNFQSVTFKVTGNDADYVIEFFDGPVLRYSEGDGSICSLLDISDNCGLFTHLGYTCLCEQISSTEYHLTFNTTTNTAHKAYDIYMKWPKKGNSAIFVSSSAYTIKEVKGFDRNIVEGGQESVPGVNGTKNDQSHTQLAMSQELLDSNSPYIQLHFEIKYNTPKGSFDREKDEKLGHMNENSKNATTCTRGMAYNAVRPRLEVMRDNTLNRDILCDTQTDGGGWIVIQRRTKGDVDFYRDWAAYKHGFGSPPGDFWLGNNAIHELTNKDAYELRVELNNGTKDLFAVYSSFKLESEANNYILRLGSHSGTLGEDSTEVGFSSHNGYQFSTYDRDNDESERDCAKYRHGAWWYEDCNWVHLNGVWGERDWNGVMWMDGQQTHYAKSTQMMIRRL